MDLIWFEQNKGRFKGQPYDPHRNWDFTLYGKDQGRDVWYRWKNGEITTNHPEILEYLRQYIEYAKQLGELDDRYEDYGNEGKYFYRNLFTDPRTFRMIMQRRGFQEFEGIRGDAPEPMSGYWRY